MKRYKYKAITLVEIILYIGIFSFFIFTLSGLFVVINEAKIRSQIIEDVNREAKKIMVQMTRDIRTASDRNIVSDYILEFDGENDYVEIPTGFKSRIEPPMSFSFWVYLYDVTQSRREWFIVKESINDFGIGNRDGALVIYTGSVNRSWGKDSVLKEQEWQHIIVTYDKDRNQFVEVFVDGVKVEPDLYSNYSNTPSDKYFRFGQMDEHWNDLYFGRMSDVRIYERIITDIEVVDLYNHKEIDKAGLKGHWRLNEGDGCTVYDLSGNNNHGSLEPDCSLLSPSWVEGDLRPRELVLDDISYEVKYGSMYYTFGDHTPILLTSNRIFVDEFNISEVSQGDFGDLIKFNFLLSTNSPNFNYSVRFYNSVYSRD